MTPRFSRVLGGGDHGATAVEYALMASLIAAVVVAAVLALGLSLNGLFANAAALI